MIVMVHAWNAEITARGRARGMPVPDLNEIAVTHPVAVHVPALFPAADVQRLVVLSHPAARRGDRLFELWSLSLYPEDEKRCARWRPYRKPMTTELPGDSAAGLQQPAAAAVGPACRGIRFHAAFARRRGMISNYQRLIDGYLAGLQKDQLLERTQVACADFDVPIEDIGSDR